MARDAGPEAVAVADDAAADGAARGTPATTEAAARTAKEVTVATRTTASSHEPRRSRAGTRKGEPPWGPALNLCSPAVSTGSSAEPAPKGPLPEGTIAVGVGLAISGLAAYIFLGVANRAIGDDPYAALAQLWFLNFVLAPGFFLPIEQEMGRALAHRRALGEGGLPVVRRAAVLGLGLIVILLAIMGALSPVLVDEVLHGSWPLFVALLLSVTGWALTYIVRGALSGSGEFSRFGLLLGADGALRVAMCVALSLAGVDAPGAYGLTVAAPPFLAIALAVRGKRNMLEPGPEASWAELTPNLGWLLAGSVLAASLVNAGPLATNLLAEDADKDLVAAFANGVLISRIPLFMFQAVQSALLPKLAKLAAQREIAEFRSGFRRLMLVVVAVGTVGTLGAFAVGPFALDTAFGSDLGRRTLTLLALAASLYMGAVAIAQALIALHGHAKVAIGWGLAMAAFVIVTLVAGSDLLLRVELGLVAGSTVALAAFWVMLRQSLAAGTEPDPASLFEAIHDLPLEP